MRRLLVLGILLAVTPALAKTSQGHSRTVQLARTAWRPGTFDIYFVPAADNIVADKARWSSHLPVSAGKPGAPPKLEKREHYGTTHATLHDYDQRVPLIFYGDRYFKQGSYTSPASPADIAPTLGQMLGVPLSGELAGKPLRDILTKDAPAPRAILLVVVDQMGNSTYRLHASQMPYVAGLLEHGAFFREARLDYAQSMTAVSHAVIGTGAHPKLTGIWENKLHYLTLAREEEVYVDATPTEAGKDVKQPAVGQKVDVLQLLVPTLIDVWGMRQKDAKNLGYCMASRAAVGLVGHGAAYHAKGQAGRTPAVFWFDSDSQTFVTDRRWFSMPEVLKQEPPVHWDELAKSNQALPYWSTQTCISKPSKDNKPVTNCLLASPAFARHEGDLLVKVLESGDYGKDDTTDIIAINFKSADYCGHYMGPESGECGETLTEIDNQIARVAAVLTKSSDGKLAVVLTADHGVAPTPEVSGGKLLGDVELRDMINEHFAAKKPAAPLVLRVGASTIQIDHQVAAARGITLDKLRKFLESDKFKEGGKPFFVDVVTADEIAATR